MVQFLYASGGVQPQVVLINSPRDAISCDNFITTDTVLGVEKNTTCELHSACTLHRHGYHKSPVQNSIQAIYMRIRLM